MSIKKFRKDKKYSFILSNLTQNQQFVSILIYWSPCTHIYRLGNNAGVTQLSRVLPFENNHTHTHGLITYIRPVGIRESLSEWIVVGSRRFYGKETSTCIGSVRAKEREKGCSLSGAPDASWSASWPCQRCVHVIRIRWTL